MEAMALRMALERRIAFGLIERRIPPAVLAVSITWVMAGIAGNDQPKEEDGLATTKLIASSHTSTKSIVTGQP